MKKEDLYRHVDHTALKAFTAWEDIQTLCQQAYAFRMASVCIPSSYVKMARNAYPELNICTVIGFPLGNANVAAKCAEAKQAIEDGASEIDMVINISMLKNRNYKGLENELRVLRSETAGKILKVIIETCYLTEEEKIKMCELVTKSGADYIKTSTGFGPAGAVLEDVLLMKEHIGPDVRIKASGGIRTREEMEAFIGAGCSRIGTSCAIQMLE